MATKRDYYEILDVKKTSSAAEIKKAYRKKALEWHPDRNKTARANEKFKEINEAYEVLSKPQKKQQYDQFGHAAFDPRYGAGGPGAGPFGGSTRTQQRGPFSYTYTTHGASPEAGAEGFSDPFEIFEQFFGGASPFARASRISRYGLTLTLMEAVKGCEKEVVIEGKKRKLKIPEGVDDGSQIRFENFYITIDVQPDKIFQRDGADIFVNQEISLSMAILGGTVEVPTIEGKVNLRIRAGTQSGTMVRLRNRGIKRLRGFGKGDQYIRLQVKIPQHLSRKQKELIKEFEE